MKSNATPKLSFVFDRKKKATKTVEAPVEILIYYNYKKKYLTTSTSLCAGQWLYNKVVNRADAASLNKSLADMYVEVNNYIYNTMQSGAFSLSCLDKFKNSTKNVEKQESAESPFSWMEERLSTRTIRESTRDNHLRMIADIKASGIFETWEDFTPANILRWDDRLKKRLNRQTSIHCYHKRLKMFLHEAEIFGMIKQDPYKFIKIKVGRGEEIKYLTKDERRRIEHLELEGPEEKARDLFIFACYTGLSFCDLQKIRVEDIKYYNGQYVIEDKRQKTGTTYHIVLLPQAMNILKKYDFTNFIQSFARKEIASSKKNRKPEENIAAHL